MFEVLSQSVAATADRKSLGNLLWISTAKVFKMTAF
jgi:hypothetical protein